MHALLPILAALLLCACGTAEDTGETAMSQAIVDPERSSHFFDLPFPSDSELTAKGHPDLTGFPVTPSDITREIIAGWARRLEATASGYANNGAAYFRFQGPLDLPDVLTGLPTDPVLLIDVETGELIPLTLRFTVDPGADPFLAENLLAMAPALGHPPASGATLAAVVMQSAGASPAEGWQVPVDVTAALDKAGVSGSPAVATVFTVQDATGQLRALAADADRRMGDKPDWGAVSWKRVSRISYAPGTTPSGEEATVFTATYEDGSSRINHLYAHDADESTHSTDLMDGWPMAVYEAEIPVLNYSGLTDQPYMSPGFSHLFDTARESGWIDLEHGEVITEPDADTMRIVISIPKDALGQPIRGAELLIYDHGTGGHAYNSVQRLNVHDLGGAWAQVLVDAGVAIIGRDAPLYGTRFDLIDAGYSGGSLGYYNVVNLPAFRDNQRQTALEGHILIRFIQTGLNDTLPAGRVRTTGLRRFGHSLGSVTANLGLAMDPDLHRGALLSGTGGVLSHYFLDTGLIEDIGPELIGQLFSLFGVQTPEQVTAAKAMGAALGLPEQAWDGIDRLHPVITLFQWTMDPGDPMSVARDEQVRTRLIVPIGDHQVPNFTTWALSTALPDVSVVECQPLGDYDPHYCMHRELQGQQILAEWLAE
jgi:hypothetical protein